MIKIKDFYNGKQLVIIGNVGFCGCRIFTKNQISDLAKSFSINEEDVKVVTESFDIEEKNEVTLDFLESEEVKKVIKKKYKKQRLFALKVFNGLPVDKSLLKSDFLLENYLEEFMSLDILTDDEKYKLLKKSVKHTNFSLFLDFIDKPMAERIFKKKFIGYMNWRERIKLFEITEGSKIEYYLNNIDEEDIDVWDKMCEYFDIEKHSLVRFIEKSSLIGIKILFKKYPNEMILELNKQGRGDVLFKLNPKFILEDNVYEALDDVLEIDKETLRKLYERAK